MSLQRLVVVTLVLVPFASPGVPVLAAAVGGVPDMIRHGENGLLHRGNDREDLACKLREVAQNPAMLARLRAGITPPASMGEHAVQMAAIYAECVADGA